MTREMALVREACGESDFSDGVPALHEKGFCTLDTALNYVLMDSHAYGVTEESAEV